MIVEDNLFIGDGANESKVSLFVDGGVEYENGGNVLRPWLKEISNILIRPETRNLFLLNMQALS